MFFLTLLGVVNGALTHFLRIPAFIATFSTQGVALAIPLIITGAQSISIGESRPEVTDRLVISVTGPKSAISFEVFFARDAARTPLLVKVPFSVGILSMELVR